MGLISNATVLSQNYDKRSPNFWDADRWDFMVVSASLKAFQRCMYGGCIAKKSRGINSDGNIFRIAKYMVIFDGNDHRMASCPQFEHIFTGKGVETKRT